MKAKTVLHTSAAFLPIFRVNAQSDNCTDVLKPSYQAPVVGSGWVAQLIVSNATLTSPRGIIFDSNDHLLVVEQGIGIKSITFKDGGGTCLSIASSLTLVEGPGLNHGIAFSNDGKTLYASSSSAVYSWPYDPQSGSITGSMSTVIQMGSGSDHVTRTLLMSSKRPGTLLVSKGSTQNIDLSALDVTTGVSQIRAFNMTNSTGTAYDYASSGTLLGWGLRNSVGVAEEPLTGGIFAVENSADQITRDGVDIHQDNPGEEMNFLGFLNGSTEHQGGNYGYPDCFALWDTNIPDVGGMQTGDQFCMSQNSTLNDTTCQTEKVAPRLTFQAHMAPLDIKFVPDGSLAYVSFHGSWDRTNPIGYKVSTVTFSSGQPVAPPNSTTALVDILSNADNSVCPDQCFRPVGLALDSKGRLYMSSDSTGEIYVLQNADFSASGGGTTGSPTTTMTGSATGTGTFVQPTATSSSGAEHGSFGNRIGARAAYIGGEGKLGWGTMITALAGSITGFGAWLGRLAWV